MRAAPVIGFVVIAGAFAFGARSFVTNLTPYVPFREARAATSSVQVMGGLDKQSVTFDGALNFTLIEPKTGERLPVRFGHTRPPNFASAIEVTAIGRWDGGTFQADRLLTKCPSKYQGTETKEYRAAG
jgi:cytochrome c-type biogenesis protein CcmE